MMNQLNGDSVLRQRRMLVRRFEDRARILIKRGFNPKDAVEVVLQETELEYRIDPGGGEGAS